MSLDIPLSNLASKMKYLRELIEERKGAALIFICRRGNHSQEAVLIAKKSLFDCPSLKIVDVIGGYCSWAKEIDSTFPSY